MSWQVALAIFFAIISFATARFFVSMMHRKPCQRRGERCPFCGRSA